MHHSIGAVWFSGIMQENLMIEKETTQITEKEK
jgi:hypothetical protein